MYVFNAIIFVDLYLTLKNPFYPREKRTMYYYLLTACAMLTWIVIYFIIKPDENVQIISDIVFNISTLIPIISTFSVLRRLCLRGTSRKLKNIMCRRYFSYLCIYLLLIIGTNMPYIPELYLDQMGKNGLIIMQNIVSVAGIVLAMIRLFEPYVFDTCKQMLTQKTSSK